jgi:hypothetical protein
VLARASTRRRLPVHDGSCDLILRRLAPGLPEEVLRVLAPGGYYLRFTFGPGHWREVYDLMPGLPRAREDVLAGEAERLRDLGLEVEEPVRHEGAEDFTSAAVMLALRSNPAAYHADRLDFRPMRGIWDDGSGGRRQVASLSTQYAILVARKPAAAAAVEPPAEKPKRTRRPKAEPTPVPVAEEPTPTLVAEEPPVEAAAPTVEAPPVPEKPKRVRRKKADEEPAPELVAEVPPAAEESPAAEAPPAADEAAPEKPKRARRKKADEPASPA